MRATHNLGYCTEKGDYVWVHLSMCVSFRIISCFVVPTTNEEDLNLLFSDVLFLKALTLCIRSFRGHWQCTDLMWHELAMLLGSLSSLVVAQAELVIIEGKPTAEISDFEFVKILETKGQTFDQKFTKSIVSSWILEWHRRLSSFKPE